MDDVTDEASSNVKFVSKRSMTKLRAERSRQKLQTQASTTDLESSIMEEPKTDASVLALPIDQPSGESTESLGRKPVVWEAPMAKANLIVILAWYVDSLT